MKCSKCGHELEEGQKFCMNCGTKVEIISGKVCPNCHQVVEEGMAFCKHCGTKLEEEKVEEHVCPNCHQPVMEGLNFCMNCGTRVSGESVPEKEENLCKNCNQPLEEGMKFCKHCGTPVSSVEETMIETPIEEPVEETVEEPIEEKPIEAAPAKQSKPLDAKLIGIIVGCVIAVCAIGFFGFKMLGGDSSKEEETEEVSSDINSVVRDLDSKYDDIDDYLDRLAYDIVDSGDYQYVKNSSGNYVYLAAYDVEALGEDYDKVYFVYDDGKLVYGQYYGEVNLYYQDGKLVAVKEGDTVSTKDLDKWDEAAKKQIRTIKKELKEAPAVQTTDGDYILPNIQTVKLTNADLDVLTKEQIYYARNEMYARHGRKFTNEQLQQYFNSKSWYTPTIDPDKFEDEVQLNEIEIYNRDFIVNYEKAKGYR